MCQHIIYPRSILIPWQQLFFPSLSGQEIVLLSIIFDIQFFYFCFPLKPSRGWFLCQNCLPFFSQPFFLLFNILNVKFLFPVISLLYLGFNSPELWIRFFPSFCPAFSRTPLPFLCRVMKIIFLFQVSVSPPPPPSLYQWLTGRPPFPPPSCYPWTSSTPRYFLLFYIQSPSLSFFVASAAW